MPAGYESEAKWRAWIQAGCLASEMESAALYIVAQVLRARAGCILSVVWNPDREKQGLPNPHYHDTTDAARGSGSGAAVDRGRARELTGERPHLCLI